MRRSVIRFRAPRWAASADETVALKNARRRRVAAGTLLVAAVHIGAGVAGAAFLRTETRQACGGRDPASYSPSERRPFFGDLHIHTSYSIDAFVFDVRNDPRAAYDFARGLPIPLTSVDHTGATKVQLRRPLDFAAVTDHAEGFGPAYICATPEAPGYDAAECRAFRGEGGVPARANLLLLIAGVGGARPVNLPMCSEPGIDCPAGAAQVWQDTRAANEEAYDRTAACSFTSFVAYEWTPMPGGANLHRNVIFRNDRVLDKPVDYFETQTYEATRLWELLRERCLGRDGGTLGVDSGCDVLTIPHNSNMSAGLMFPDPNDTDVARERQFFEPLVEIIQHKGSSECRWDPTFNAGTDTTDEQCSFEILDAVTLFPVPGPSSPKPPEAFPRRSFVRNVLKDGLILEQNLGVNPFKLGIIGATDNHYATSGNTDEKGWVGHVGNQDDTPTKRLTDGGVARTNPGGLSVVWAEENSRDALFEAMRRRETYGTSGTRPIVRFFGGWSYPDDLCQRTDQLAVAYDGGVPMGGDLPYRGSATAPRFFVSALKDSDIGTPLQRLQIIKGWVGSDGAANERVYDVDGGPNGATVDKATCAPTGTGADQRCALWTDPDFDPAVPAFYYARVLEDPTCRWSTYDCKGVGVDPFSPDCRIQAVTARPGTNFSDCCRLPPTVQERAWTSPIWYQPNTAPPPSCAGLCSLSPAPGCGTSGQPRRAILDLKDHTPKAKDALGWKWRGSAATADFGDPRSATTYALCVYDGASNLVSQACAPASGVCAGKLCWNAARGGGFTYRDRNRTPEGVDRIVLKPGADGRAKLLVKGRGEHLAMPTLPLAGPVKVQMKNTAGACWEATYSTARKNTSSRFQAQAD